MWPCPFVYALSMAELSHFYRDHMACRGENISHLEICGRFAGTRTMVMAHSLRPSDRATGKVGKMVGGGPVTLGASKPPMR